MVEMTAVYQGQLRTEATHGPSGATIATDAPVDNMGRGEAFSPTDLVATALGTCIVTTMAIVADRSGIDLIGTTARMAKGMTTSSPRKIEKLVIEVTSPLKPDPEQQQRLEAAGRGCPVHRSLHPDVQIELTFKWGF